MKNRPYVIISCAMSLDGYIDDARKGRLILSNKEDLRCVDILRASSDAIFIGANTIRKDNPKLLIRSKRLQIERVNRGLPAHPTKVTITKSGNLTSSARFFTTGGNEKLVYCTAAVYDKLRKRLEQFAKVIAIGADDVDIRIMLEDLTARGVKKLLIEGGSRIITLFLGAGLVDELRIAVAPFFIGDAKAPKLISAELYDKKLRLRLRMVEKIGDMGVLIYDLSKIN